MQLPADIRQTLANEFRFATQQMADAPNFQAQLYLFSALYGAAFRALNLAWSDELALMHLVLRSAHQEIVPLAEGLGMGQRVFGVPPEIPQALTQVCTELATALEADRTDAATLYPLLARVAEISYATTGNGRYIYLKGQITI